MDQYILTGHIDDVDDIISQFPAVVSGQVISAWLYYYIYIL